MARSGMYVTCLDCGQELSYDWKEMRLGKPVAPQGVAQEPEPAFRPSI
jgi:hypothetical protein